MENQQSIQAEIATPNRSLVHLGLRPLRLQNGLVPVIADQQRREALRRQIEADAELERQEAAKRQPQAPSAAPPSTPPAVPTPSAVAAPAPAPAIPSLLSAARGIRSRGIDEMGKKYGFRTGFVPAGASAAGGRASASAPMPTSAGPAGSPFVVAPPGVPKKGDHISAELEHGEAVLPAKTVREIGPRNLVDIIRKTNDGKMPHIGLRGESKFADGFVPEDETDLGGVPADTAGTVAAVPRATSATPTVPSAGRGTVKTDAAMPAAQGNTERDAGLRYPLDKQYSIEQAIDSDPGAQGLKSLASNEGARNTFNTLQESKGSPVRVTADTLADGRSVPLIHGSGGGVYVAADGTPTGDWTKTAAYAEGVKRAEKDIYDAAVLDIGEAARTRSGAEGEAQKQAAIARVNLGAQGLAARRGVDATKALQHRKLLGEIGMAEARTANARQQAINAQEKTDAAVALFLEQNPNATPAQVEAIRRGVKLGDSLTPVQQRGNIEIDKAREMIAGLTPEEIRRRTAKTTDTGRDNPAFDPDLERAARLASRRKIGADDWFDQRQPPARPAFDRSGIEQRFRADSQMGGYTLGKEVPGRGIEVLDRGRVVGYYR